METTCKIKLTGHNFDLERAFNYFKTDKFSILIIDNDYYLSSKDFNNIEDTNEISIHAQAFLEKINGILKLKYSDYKSISLDYIFIFESEKGVRKIALMEAKLSGRGTLSVHSTTSNEENETVIKNQNEILNNTTASIVFHFYSQPTSWINLYKIFEIIRDEIGQKKIDEILTRNERSRFTGTAQSIDLLGDDARHASKKEFKGTKQPMTILEANELIKKLIIEWSHASL